MACSYILSLGGASFTSNGIYYSSLTPNFNNSGLSQSDVTEIDCDSMLFGYKGGISLPINGNAKHYGFIITVNNVITEDCGAVFDWHPLLRYIITWNPQFKDTEGTSYSAPFSKEFNYIANGNSPFSIHSIYDSNSLTSSHNVGFDIPRASDLVNEFQPLIDRFLGDKGKFFDKFTYTPNFIIKEIGIYKNFGCTGSVGLFNYQCECDESECIDKRSSTDLQQLRFIVSDGLQNVSDFTIDFNISDGSTQEIGINTYMNDTAYNTFINLYNLNQNVMARCMFVGGVIRPSCTVRLVAKVYGQSLGVGSSITPPFVDLDFNPLMGTDVDVLRAQFDPCNDKPVRIQEDLTAFINGLKANVPTVGFSLYQVIPYKIVISGLSGTLSDYCCDDSVPVDDDSLEYGAFIEPILQGYGGTGAGGGDDVNIQCICDNLSTINNTLVAFKESNSSALASIDEAIQNISIEGGSSSCICDNLENISDGVIAIKEAIDDKNLSVVNNNTVQPPVNNISVQPPINNISLPTTQLEDIATNTRALNCVCSSLQNLEVVGQGTIDSIDSVKSNLECGNNNLACILESKTLSVDVDMNNADITNGLDSIVEKLDDINSSVHDGLFNSDDESNLQNISESLNTSDDDSKSLTDVLSDSLNTSDDESESLADVINNKEMGTNIDVEVSPADDVNINRVYYTNQRNGETNI